MVNSRLCVFFYHNYKKKNLLTLNILNTDHKCSKNLENRDTEIKDFLDLNKS